MAWWDFVRPGSVLFGVDGYGKERAKAGSVMLGQAMSGRILSGSAWSGRVRFDLVRNGPFGRFGEARWAWVLSGASW